VYALDLATQHEEWLDRTETKQSPPSIKSMEKKNFVDKKKMNAGVYALDLATRCGHLIPVAASSSGTLCVCVCE
jgi:hypothetical protein